MLGPILIAAGALLMAVGAAMLSGWVGGWRGWSQQGAPGRRWGSQADWVQLLLQFLGAVVFPLLGGTILILLGLWLLGA